MRLLGLLIVIGVPTVFWTGLAYAMGLSTVGIVVLATMMIACLLVIVGATSTAAIAGGADAGREASADSTAVVTTLARTDRAQRTETPRPIAA